MRIVAGAWRGRALLAPPGETTRPTSDRARQALFDTLWHADWAGRAFIEEARVLDGFAGTGALGLEALSRGAVHCTFLEQDRAALGALRANIAALGAAPRSTVRAGDTRRPPAPIGGACSLIFLDPPYGKDLVSAAVIALQKAGWAAPGALVVAELGRQDPLPNILTAGDLLAERRYGAARIAMWRLVL